MTLIIAAGNATNAYLVSDRRISELKKLGNGHASLRTDESNKAFTMNIRAGRFVIGYSGLAELAGHDPFAARLWIPQTFAELSATCISLRSILDEFSARATARFSRIRADSRHKRLTIIGIGYLYPDDGPQLSTFRITNFESLDLEAKATDHARKEFSWWGYYNDAVDGTVIRITAGARTISNATNVPYTELYEWLKENRHPDAILSRAIKTIRSHAGSGYSGGTVGAECSSIVLPRDLSSTCRIGYHSTKVKHDIYVPGLIEMRGEPYGNYILTDSMFGAADDTGRKAIVSVPQVRKRWPCPCGSGVRYRFCHGPKAPQASRVEFEMGSFPD